MTILRATFCESRKRGAIPSDTTGAPAHDQRQRRAEENMTDQDSNTTGHAPTYQERFTDACNTQKFKPYELIQGPDAGYLVWEVQHVSDGRQVTIDGPYFTEEEARISAGLLRGTFRGAKASETIYNRVWNYDPRQERLTIDQAQMSRAVLAIRLGLPAPSITV